MRGGRVNTARILCFSRREKEAQGRGVRYLLFSSVTQKALSLTVAGREQVTGPACRILDKRKRRTQGAGWDRRPASVAHASGPRAGQSLSSAPSKLNKSE